MRNKISVGCILAMAAVGVFLFANRNDKNYSKNSVEQSLDEILKSRFSLDLFKSWKTLDAAGGRSSSFLDFRPRNDFFLLAEASASALESLAKELGARHAKNDFRFFSFADNTRIVMPHNASLKFAPWWQPETNSEPMMSAQFNDQDIVYLYGFKKSTNALIYVHTIVR